MLYRNQYLIFLPKADCQKGTWFPDEQNFFILILMSIQNGSSISMTMCKISKKSAVVVKVAVKMM